MTLRSAIQLLREAGDLPVTSLADERAAARQLAAHATDTGVGMMVPKDEERVSIEPKFNEVSEEEEDRALRVKLVFILVFGPPVGLALAGFYDAAEIALMISFVAAFAILYLLFKLDEMDL